MRNTSDTKRKLARISRTTTVLLAETWLVRPRLFFPVDGFATRRRRRRRPRGLEKLSDQLRREETFLVDGFRVTSVCIVYRCPRARRGMTLEGLEKRDRNSVSVSTLLSSHPLARDSSGLATSRTALKLHQCRSRRAIHVEISHRSQRNLS